MEDQTYRELMLSEELRTSIRLIELGFGEIQNLRKSNSFHHLPFQLLSSGIERLLKCHICFGFLQQNERLPSFKELKKCGGRSGHDILELHKEVMLKYFRQPVPTLIEDYLYVSTNTNLRTLLELLSEFGKYSRYYNLNIVSGAEKPSRNIEQEWRSFETDLALEHNGIVEQLTNVDTANFAIDFINREVIILLERFVCAIARQFTVGQLGQKAQQHSSVLMFYITMREEELGNTNYLEEVTRFKTQKKKPKKRTICNTLKSRYSTKVVNKRIRRREFEGEWPFYHDEIIIECREGHWCMVTICGYDYALNGSAQSRFKLENVHDSGMAILGKSIQPFIEICFELWENKNSN